jgi:hypothetical protein
MYSSKILIVENFLLSARFNGRFIAATAFGLRLASLTAVRFASAAKAAAKRQRPSASDSLRSLLSVLPVQLKLRQKGNGLRPPTRFARCCPFCQCS